LRGREAAREDPSDESGWSDEGDVFSGERENRLDELSTVETSGIAHDVLWELQMKISAERFGEEMSHEGIKARDETHCHFELQR
jgi:hypothetical protein